MQLRRWRLAITLVVTLLILGSCSVFRSSVSKKPEQYIAIYTAQPGDSLSSIAAGFELSAYEIFTANTLADPRTLQVGDVLRIPFPIDTPPERLKGLKLAKHHIDLDSIERVRQDTSRRFVNKLLWPIENCRLGSPYGERNGKAHTGIDLPASKGTSVMAAHNGVVTYAGNGMSGYGNVIIINDGSLSTLYAHNSKLLVQIGDPVFLGQTVAMVGTTGRSTGPHLHFETRIRDPQDKLVPVDPLVFYPLQQ